MECPTYCASSISKYSLVSTGTASIKNMPPWDRKMPNWCPDWHRPQCSSHLAWHLYLKHEAHFLHSVWALCMAASMEDPTQHITKFNEQLYASLVNMTSCHSSDKKLSDNGSILYCLHLRSRCRHAESVFILVTETYNQLQQVLGSNNSKNKAKMTSKPVMLGCVWPFVWSSSWTKKIAITQL